MFSFVFVCVGKKILEKFKDVRKALKELNADSFIVTSLEDIACKCFMFVFIIIFVVFLFVTKLYSHFFSSLSSALPPQTDNRVTEFAW